MIVPILHDFYDSCIFFIDWPKILAHAKEVDEATLEIDLNY